MAVSIVPVLCLCGLTFYQLIKEARVRHGAANARDNAVNSFHVSAALTSLLVSRLTFKMEDLPDIQLQVRIGILTGRESSDY